MRKLIVFIAIAALTVSASVAFYLWARSQSATIHLTLTTGQRGATYYPLGNLIARSVRDAGTRIEITVVESSGSIENVERLASGEAELAIVQNDTRVESPVRTLIPLHRGVMHFMAHKDAGITSIEDLRGKRVAIGVSSSGSRQVVDQLLEHFGIGTQEFLASDKPLKEEIRRMLQGELDAILFMAAIDSETARRLIRSGQITYVSFASQMQDGNEVDGFAVTYPYIQKCVIPMRMHEVSGDSAGQPSQPCITFSMRSALIAQADLDADVAKQIVRAIVNDRAAMMRQNQAAAEISEQFSSQDVHFPLHDGAVAFYRREDPGFLERYAETMAFLLSVVLFLYGAGVGISKWILRNKKNRIDVYYSQLDQLLSELGSGSQSAGRLKEINEELVAMRRRAVKELVEERLTADESFRIFQSLLTDCQQQLALRRKTLAEQEPTLE